jgi:Txe/YoeB family toxin of Txe-Axe toxin-antitoxin module
MRLTRIGLLLRGLLLAAFKLALGSVLGLLALEASLRVNPGLLLRGAVAPSPVDPPVTVETYVVRYSDADVFYWHRNLIRPIPPEADKIEAHVRFETDEFGFPNPAPVPAAADVVVLGRSYSVGANAEAPWPRLLSEQGFEVANLSQGGSSIDLKLSYLRNFGFPRHPRWVIVDVLPGMDVLGYQHEDSWLVEQMSYPLMRLIARQALGVSSPRPPDNPIYPLTFDIPGSTLDASFYSLYLASLTLSRDQIAASVQWSAYVQDLLALVKEARTHQACVVLLYVPTKENIYFSLAEKPEQLQPALTGWWAWRLTAEGRLVEDFGTPGDVAAMQANALAARDVLGEFARENGLPFVDPSAVMAEAATVGDRPFMVYDTHWSAIGHRLVARLVGDTLRQSTCP